MPKTDIHYESERRNAGDGMEPGVKAVANRNKGGNCSKSRKSEERFPTNSLGC